MNSANVNADIAVSVGGLVGEFLVLTDAPALWITLFSSSTAELFRVSPAGAPCSQRRVACVSLIYKS